MGSSHVYGANDPVAQGVHNNSFIFVDNAALEMRPILTPTWGDVTSEM